MWNPLSEEVVHGLADIVVLSGVIAGKAYLDRKAKHRQRHAPLEVIHEHDVRINAALDAAMYSTGATRVYVAQYRNGAIFDSGNPLMRKCRTHERCAGGVSGQSLDYREMPMNRVPEEFALVKADGHSFTAVADLPEGYFRSLCELDQIVGVARVALRREKNIVGFVGADYGMAAEPPNMVALERAAGIVSLQLASTAVKA